MELTYERLGIINLSKDVMVTDPCYEVGTWCQIRLDNVKPGKYEAFVVKSDEGDWGIRCSSLIVKHIDMKFDECTEILTHDGEVGVDSGQAGIFDMSIYPEVPHKRGHENKFYEECCDLTLSKIRCGALLNRKGIVSSTGYGDGSYPLCYSINNEGQIDYMHIIYIGPDVDYDDENYDLSYSEALESYFSTIHGLIFN